MQPGKDDRERRRRGDRRAGAEPKQSVGGERGEDEHHGEIVDGTPSGVGRSAGTGRSTSRAGTAADSTYGRRPRAAGRAGRRSRSRRSAAARTPASGGRPRAAPPGSSIQNCRRTDRADLRNSPDRRNRSARQGVDTRRWPRAGAHKQPPPHRPTNAPRPSALQPSPDPVDDQGEVFMRDCADLLERRPHGSDRRTGFSAAGWESRERPGPPCARPAAPGACGTAS